MFYNNITPTNNRLIQVSEQTFDPIRVPVVIGNEVYCVTQQDVRNIIDTRLITFTKLNGNNGSSETRTAEGNSSNVAGNVQDFINFLKANQNFPFNQHQEKFDFMQQFMNFYQSAPQQSAAPIQTQLDWEMKYVPNENPTTQFSNMKNTTTAELNSFHQKNNVQQQQTEFNFCHRCRKCKGTYVCDDDFFEESSKDPSARQILKQKKITKNY